MNIFVQAIEQRQLLEFSYDGLARVVVPAVYGYRHNGNLALRCYQVRGATHSSTGELWRSLTVSKIVGVHLLAENFDAAPQGYRRNDQAFSFIIARL